MQQQKKENKQLIKLLTQKAKKKAGGATPNFTAFDPYTELWMDYLSCFRTFIRANSINEDRVPQIYLTNQSKVFYKQLTDWSEQQTLKKDINTLTMNDIEEYIKTQYNPRTFIIRERYRYWSNIKRNPGETIQELAERIQHDATTCEFATITDAQEEPLRTRFICSVRNEAILKALFKLKDDELFFGRAIDIAMEMEEAAKVEKEMVHGVANPVQKVNKKKTNSKTSHTFFTQQNCYRCGKANHKPADCRYKTSICNYCKITGHLEVVCQKKQKGSKPINWLKAVKTVSNNPQVQVDLILQDHNMTLEVDTGAGDNFLSIDKWRKLGSLALKLTSALRVSTRVDTKLHSQQHEKKLQFGVSDIPNLNLLEGEGIDNLTSLYQKIS